MEQNKLQNAQKVIADLKSTIDKNDSRRQQIGTLDDNDVLLEKKMFIFLHDFIQILKEGYHDHLKRQEIGKIINELKRNSEIFEKEEVVKQIMQELKGNQELTELMQDTKYKDFVYDTIQTNMERDKEVLLEKLEEGDITQEQKDKIFKEAEEKTKLNVEDVRNGRDDRQGMTSASQKEAISDGNKITKMLKR